MRSRFQSAGPQVAEPLATSNAPSAAGASAVMHLTSGLAADGLPVVAAAGENDAAIDKRRPPRRRRARPASALISASKEAAGGSPRRARREAANVRRQTTNPSRRHRQIVGRRRLEHDRGAVEQVVGTERAVHRRRRDRGLAAAEPAVQSLPAPTSSALAPIAIACPVQFGIGVGELEPADAVVGDAAEIEIAAMFAHRGDRRMVLAREVP